MKEKELLELVVKKQQMKVQKTLSLWMFKAWPAWQTTLSMQASHEQPSLEAIAENIREKVAEVGGNASHVEGDSAGGWVLLDLGSVVVHVFRRNACPP